MVGGMSASSDRLCSNFASGDPENDARTALGEDAYDTGRAEGYAMDSEAAAAYAAQPGQ